MKAPVFDKPLPLRREEHVQGEEPDRGPETGDDEKEGTRQGLTRRLSYNSRLIGIKLRVVAWKTRPTVRLVQRQPKLTRNEFSRAAARR